MNGIQINPLYYDPGLTMTIYDVEFSLEAGLLALQSLMLVLYVLTCLFIHDNYRSQGGKSFRFGPTHAIRHPSWQ
jgi:hypothetical protein